MSGEFRFETFVDTHSNIFNEYLSSIIAHLSKENEEYKTVQNEIESLYQQYPKSAGCVRCGTSDRTDKGRMYGGY